MYLFPRLFVSKSDEGLTVELSFDSGFRRLMFESMGPDFWSGLLGRNCVSDFFKVMVGNRSNVRSKGYVVDNLYMTRQLFSALLT